MTWREELQPASFRGVPFEVEGDNGSFGRRVQVHEYPQRDTPWTEDLGRATRAFEITAFLVGDDYLRHRDALLTAIETQGPGTLVHPWYGELTVNVKDLARVVHSHRHGGMCEISLSFVEAGELTFPVASQSLGAQTLLTADAVSAAAVEEFTESFAVDGHPSFVLESVVADLKGYIETAEGYLDTIHHVMAHPLEALLDLAGLPSNPGSALEAVLGLPAGIADSMIDLYDRAGSILHEVAGLFGRRSANARNRNAVVALCELSTALGASAVLPASTIAIMRTSNVRALTTSTRYSATVQTQINRAALAALFQRSTLIQAAGMSAAMPLPVYDDAVLVRDSVVTAIEQASFEATDEVFVQLQVLRSRVHADITARLSQAARLLDYTPRAVMPALALAYDLYDDVDRETELVERNGLRHPGFVPARSIKVLSA